MMIRRRLSYKDFRKNAKMTFWGLYSGFFFSFTLHQMFNKVSIFFLWQNFILQKTNKGLVTKTLRQGPTVSLLRRWWKHVSHWNHSKSSQCPAAFWKLPPITFPRENTHIACILLNWLLEKHNIRDIWWHFSYLKWHGHMASQGVGEIIQWWFQNSRHPLQIL